MTTFTDYLWFNTKTRQEFIRITDEVSAIVKKSGGVIADCRMQIADCADW